MTDKKRAWARITTASSAALLLMAVISVAGIRRLQRVVQSGEKLSSETGTG